MAPFYKKETISKTAYKKLIAILEEYSTSINSTKILRHAC